MELTCSSFLLLFGYVFDLENLLINMVYCTKRKNKLISFVYKTCFCFCCSPCGSSQYPANFEAVNLYFYRGLLASSVLKQDTGESSTTLSCATRSIITWLIYLFTKLARPYSIRGHPCILVSCDSNIYPIMHSERIFSLNVCVIPIWNHLPQDVVTSLNITVFRTRLRSVNLSPFCMLSCLGNL